MLSYAEPFSGLQGWLADKCTLPEFVCGTALVEVSKGTHYTLRLASTPRL